MRKLFLILALLLLPGCIVANPDEFRIGGEVRAETSGIMDYITGFKLRIFGGIYIVRSRKERRDEGKSTAGFDPLDALLND